MNNESKIHENDKIGFEYDNSPNYIKAGVNT